MIVNTCAFIEDAEKESVETILSISRLKAAGSLKKLIVTGCLPQRYKADLENDLPEVDHFIGTGEFHRITEFTNLGQELPVVRTAVEQPEYVYDYATPRISTLPPHTSYVKIAEGCSRPCAFCIIPRLRGRGRSRTIDSVVKEVERLVSAGTVEVNLIAQDLTAYGLDLKDGTALEGLLRELVKIEKLGWIRLMYNYPQYFTDGLIDLIAGSDKICKYLDLPLQHIDDEVLKSMRRNVTERETRDLLTKLRAKIPGLTIRTTLLVGFPGETEVQFEKLLKFVEEAEFERLGVFTYSNEDGTAAANLPDPVEPDVKNERRDRVMTLQQKISAKKNAALVGKEVDVLIDRAFHRAGGYTHVGRSQGHAIEIDGSVYVRAKNLAAGQFARVKITESSEYDLFGEAS
jgi:ribosomal protein S12 methylthiotransferase